MRVQWAFPFELANVRVIASLGCMPRKEAKEVCGCVDSRQSNCDNSGSQQKPMRNRTVNAVSGVHQGSDPS